MAATAPDPGCRQNFQGEKVNNMTILFKQALYIVYKHYEQSNILTQLLRFNRKGSSYSCSKERR